MTANHIAELCVCLHSSQAHRSGGCETCGRCHRFNPVSPKVSRHALRRGQKIKRRHVADLLPGDRVLAGWAGVPGKLRLTDVKTGAMVVEVRGRHGGDPGQRWQDREVITVTDLGPTVPQLGGSFVSTVH